MDRPSAEAVMIRQPLIIQMSALPIELPALWQLTSHEMLACLSASNRVIVSHPPIFMVPRTNIHK